jgi:hypothetical protein
MWRSYCEFKATFCFPVNLVFCRRLRSLLIMIFADTDVFSKLLSLLNTMILVIVLIMLMTWCLTFWIGARVVLYQYQSTRRSCSMASDQGPTIINASTAGFLRTRGILQLSCLLITLGKIYIFWADGFKLDRKDIPNLVHAFPCWSIALCEQDGNKEILHSPRFSALKTGYELPQNIAILTLQVQLHLCIFILWTIKHEFNSAWIRSTSMLENLTIIGEWATGAR